MKNKNFVHLHLHTEYSFLKGMVKLDDLFHKAREYRMHAVAMTNYNNISGAVKFYKKAIKYGVKPIIGCEIEVAPGSRFDKRKLKSNSSFPLVLLVKNQRGYKNLCKLITAAYFEGFYYCPRIDKELLNQYSEGLIALSAGCSGEISRLVVNNKMEKACHSALEYEEIMGKNSYFIEIMDHGLKDQNKLNKGLVDLSKKTGIPLVATNNVHYIEPAHALAHEALLHLRKKNTLSNAKENHFFSNQLYFKSASSMKSQQFSVKF